MQLPGRKTYLLEPYTEIKRLPRISTARELSRVAKSSPFAKAVLPLVSKNYGSTLRAFNRLRVTRKFIEGGLLSAFLICETEDSTPMQGATDTPTTTIAGVASAQPYNIGEAPTGVPDASKMRTTELSYWLSAATDPSQRAHNVVVEQLLDHIPQEAHPWMAVPHDQVRVGKALRIAGFVAVTEAAMVELGDDCPVPREIWIRP